jgi:hypothetical protein
VSELLTHEHIPTTGRETKQLLRAYGAVSLEQFAHDIPDNGVVVDVGSGLSGIGKDVARIRDDIRWIYVDPAYQNPDILKVASQDAPPNVEFRAADITKPSMLQDLYGKVDRVYSYWLMPHLSLQLDEPALVAANELMKLLRPVGLLFIGPVNHPEKGFFGRLRYGGVQVYEASRGMKGVADDVLERTKLHGFARKKQLFLNRYKLHYGVGFVGGKRK